MLRPEPRMRQPQAQPSDLYDDTSPPPRQRQHLCFVIPPWPHAWGARSINLLPEALIYLLSHLAWPQDG